MIKRVTLLAAALLLLVAWHLTQISSDQVDEKEEKPPLLNLVEGENEERLKPVLTVEHAASVIRSRPRFDSGETRAGKVFSGLISANAGDLDLTSEQHALLVDALVEIQQIRADFEAPLVILQEIKPDSLLLVIPPYPSAGQELYSMLHARIRDVLGEDLTVLLQERVGSSLRILFGGFGEAEQAISVVKSSEDGDPIYAIYNRGRVAGTPDEKGEIWRTSATFQLNQMPGSQYGAISEMVANNLPL